VIYMCINTHTHTHTHTHTYTCAPPRGVDKRVFDIAK